MRQVDAGWPDDRPPYPGLRPFEIDEQRVFFGRVTDAEQLAERLRSPSERAEGAALLVVGPSGCGKSSLVRAGLVPVMAREPGWWTLPPIVPGAHPVAALVRELAVAARGVGLGWAVAQVRTFENSNAPIGISFSPDGTWLVVTGIFGSNPGYRPGHRRVAGYERIHSRRLRN